MRMVPHIRPAAFGPTVTGRAFIVVGARHLDETKAARVDQMDDSLAAW